MDHSRVPCRPFLEDFSAFVDGELPPGRRAEIQAHVDCCQACLDHLTAYRRGITVLRSIEAEEPFDFWTRLESRLWMGDELRLVEGAAQKAPESKSRGIWHTPAVAVAAAAVLALFVIVRGIGPGTTPMEVGPRRVQASVAITLPEVPESSESSAERKSSRASYAERSTAASDRSQVPAERTSPDPMESALARAEARTTTSLEQEIRELERRVFHESLGPSAESSLVSDGWVQPVRLGSEWSRPAIQRASLSRAVTPAPWNVDRAVSLP
jgi:hypothetical protein